jgi:hypothetical protein
VTPESTPHADTKRFSPVLPFIGIAAINILTPFLPINSQIAAVLSTASLTVIYAACIIFFALGVARRELPIPIAGAMCAVCVLAWCGVEYGMQPRVDDFMKLLQQTRSQPTTTQYFTLVYVSTLRDLALIGGASFIGSILARGIRYANMLGPISIIIAIIDIWGVLGNGIVFQMMTNKATQHIASKALTSGPQIGAVGASNPQFSIPPPNIGIGDFLFIALLLCVLVNLKMNWKLSAILMGAFISIALLGITFLPWFKHLPGLLFIGAGAVLPNLKYFSYTREEKFALLWAVLLVSILMPVLYFVFKATVLQ